MLFRSTKSITGFLKSLVINLYGIFDGILFILNERPSAIVSFGGYCSLPMNGASVLTFTKLFLHEQNSIYGTVNRLFAPFAKQIFTSFPRQFNSVYSSSVTYSGLPIRNSYLEGIMNSEKEQPDKFSILVIGGSQGAKAFDTIIPMAIGLIKKDLLANLSITQQSGRQSLQSLQELYESIGVSSEIKPFFNDIGQKLKNADLVIARAGASSIHEILIAGKASLLIPFPHAKHDHQFKNARQVEENGACLVLKEKGLNEQKLCMEIEKLIENREVLDTMAKNAKNANKTQKMQKHTKHLLTDLEQKILNHWNEAKYKYEKEETLESSFELIRKVF